MKKIMSLCLIVAFLFAFASFLPALAEETGAAADLNSVTASGQLEKIPSPEFIKFYEKIKKIGPALWGMKKAGPAQSPENQATEKLEKIASPKDINLYGKIKKVGAALWGVRKKGPRRLINAETAPCVITAIETKDKAIVDDNAGAVNKLNEAIASRTACQKTALAATDGQEEALDKCVNTFKEAFKQIKADSKKTHQTVQKTYGDSLKACSNASTTPAATATETAPEINVEDGGGNIIDASAE